MIPINEAQHQLQQLIDAVSQSHQPIVIAGKTSNAVLFSEADSASVARETLYLLSCRGCGNRLGKDWQHRSTIAIALRAGEESRPYVP